MAEGGRSIKDSDAFYDYNCSDCLSRKNAYTEAIFYCPDCKKYLCKPCLVCSHDVIGRGNVNKWGQPSMRLQFDPCSSHKANAIQLYCKKHDVVCCPVCGQTDHKLCGELQYIPLVVSAKENTTSLKRVKKELQELQTKADKLGKERASRLTGLDNKEQELVAAVKEYRAKLDTWLDYLQQQSVEKIRQHNATLFDRYKSEVALCDAIKTEMANLKKRLDTASKDQALMFTRLKQGIKQIEENNHLISDIANAEIAGKVQFVPHTNLEQWAKHLQGLGTLLTDPPVDKIQNLGLEKVNRSQGQGLDVQHAPLNQQYTVEYKTSFNVKEGDEKKTCSIHGMCQMPDGTILVADFQNESLKMLDRSYKVASHCFLTEAPNDVCLTEAGQVAVATFDKAIQFVSVGDKMIRTQSFSTDHDCNSLTYKNNCLYIVEFQGTTIYVYNLAGIRLRTISADQHGNKLFSSTRRITVNPDGARLYITDRTGLVTVDTEGNLLATFNSPDLKGGSYAVCVDRSDNVFVGGGASPNVLQVEMGERQMEEIVSSSDGIDPYRLCFDGVNLRLLVSVNGSNTIHVLYLSK